MIRPLLLLLALSALLPLASWFAEAFGMPVHSLLSAEGLRWLFTDALSAAFSLPVQQFILALMAWGSVREVLVRRPLRARLACVATLFLALLLVGLFVWLAVADSSPLLSVTGMLWPYSPFLRGLPQAVSLSLWLLALVFARVSGIASTLAQCTHLATAGLQRYPLCVLASLIFSFDYYALLFICR